MSPTLRTEIKQTKPFGCIEEEAALSIHRTAAVIEHKFAEALKPHGITGTQYNALRILRGAGKAGLCRNEVRDRLVAQVPDVTRLLDRLEESGLIERERNTSDRRQVATRITGKGLALLKSLDGPVIAMHKAQLGHLSAKQLSSLTELLALVRDRV